MTSDGLYVASLFRDSRLPGPSLPPREADLVGKPVGNLTEGGEPFNGWFGRQSDGKVRMLTGIPGQAGMIVEVRGLETIKRFRGPTFEVTQADLVRAEEANAARAAAGAEKKQYAIKRFAKAPPTDGSGEGWRDVPSVEISRKGFPEQARASLGYDDQFLYVRFDVNDASPWRNGGKDFAKLFKTGDAVDLQLSTAAGPARSDAPGPEHVRLLFAPLDGKSVCVLMRPVDKSAGADKGYDYHSPVGDRHFDRVEILDGAKVAVKVEAGRYRVEAAVPLRGIGLAPAVGAVVRGDLGFNSSDAAGTADVARTYWSNQATNLTNDLPSEAWLYPSTWGELRFE